MPRERQCEFEYPTGEGRAMLEKMLLISANKRIPATIPEALRDGA
jgi:hypothetical protein